uniref:Uncharacterized protein n=1 Tax=Rhizophora mucronata TaxID=61149 RepID=A0A2P2M091_RHIMU
MSNGSDSFNVTDLSGALNDEARAGLVNSLKVGNLCLVPENRVKENESELSIWKE